MKIEIGRLSIVLLFALVIMSISPCCDADDSVKVGTALMIWQDVKTNAFDKNTKSLQDEDAFRFKLSLFGRYDYNQNLGAFMKVGSESYYTVDSYNTDKHDFQLDELIIENLFVDIKVDPGIPVDIRMGRQELRYGDGFLIADGTPQDRERTSYFNAIKTTWRLGQRNSLDMVYLFDPKTDEFLPSLRSGANKGVNYQDHKRILTPSDEQGVILYGRNNLGYGVSLEPYYIYKREESIPATGKTAQIPTLDLHTLGARAVYKVKQWEITGEFAHQLGEYAGGRNRTGNGGNFTINRTFDDTMWKPELELGFMYLSGDNPNTATDEGWDPLFSRYNWWSKFYSSNFNTETGLASYWTNLQRYSASTTLKFTPKADLSLTYNYLRANETTKATGSAAALYSNNGKERGHLAQALLNFRFTDNISGYLLYEYLFPGDFYKIKTNESLLSWKLNFELGADRRKMNESKLY